MFLRKLFIFTGILFACVDIAYTQSREVSIAECINIALQNHPDLMASLENQNGALADYHVAKAANRVNINATANTVEYLKEGRSSSQANVPGRDTAIGLFAGLAATYNIYDPRRNTNIDVKRVSIDYAKMNSVKVRETIVKDVKVSYYNYAMERETASLRKELMKKYEEKLAKTRILYRIGQRSALDVSKAEVDLESSRIQFERSKNQENSSRTTLLTSMGIMDDNIAFSPGYIEDLPEVKFSVDELYDLSKQNYPELNMVLLQKRIGKLNVELQKASNYPTIDITAALGFENRNLQGAGAFEENLQSNNWSPTAHAGFTAAFPIYSGGAISGKIDSAVSQYNSIVYQERKLKVKVKGMIRSSFQEMSELKKQREMSLLMVDNARKHLKLTQRYYETGVGSQLEIRDAELSVLDAELTLIKTKYGYMITLANLSNLVGLGEKYLCSKK